MSNKTTHSFSAFTDALGAWGINPDEFTAIVDSVSSDYGDKIVTSVKNNPPFTNRTGRLTANQEFKQTDPLQLRFQNKALSPRGAAYGIFLHDGTKDIKAMKWFTKGWEENLPDFIRDLTVKLDKAFEV